MPKPASRRLALVFLTLFSSLALVSVAEASQNNTQLPATAAPLVAGNSTITSPNRTFELGFFSPDGGKSGYLGIWYANIYPRVITWVANRAAPARVFPPSAALSPAGRLAVSDATGQVLWSSDSHLPAAAARLLDSGNLLLLNQSGATIWQSFDHPCDTWLPGMTLTGSRPLVAWRGPADPSPGQYALRLRPAEFELVWNGSVRYWSSGRWTGDRFAGVPEMTVPYIYDFRFSDPFRRDAAFSYAVTAAEPGGAPILTRFAVASLGELRQYTWSPQAASWEMFWARPADGCQSYGRCGPLGRCLAAGTVCDCPTGLRPADPAAWAAGDFSGGCSAGTCDPGDEFVDVGAVAIDGVIETSLSGVSQQSCEESCRRNCSCFGLHYDSSSRLCRNLYGSAYNLRNSSNSPVLLLRVPASTDLLTKKKGESWKLWVPIGAIAGFLAILVSIALILAVLSRRRKGEKATVAEDECFVTLKVFSYKELSAATRGFSEKIGHGGFGAVFRGELTDSTPVAVKRLERPEGASSGAGEREFRAEVRTLGRVQHVNLSRLRGFCCEGPCRLLVYDLVPRGPLSAYLAGGVRRRSPPAAVLSWAARFRIAMGTARAIAYLHEECRECIIHCDIKPENILLDADYSPRVSDFGLAKLVGRDLGRAPATAVRGTWGYLAPEWVSGEAITAKADVYSYGMTLFEILAGRRNVEEPPDSGGGQEERWFYPAWAAARVSGGEVGAVVDSELGGEYDPEEAARAARAAVWCVQDEEVARPEMGEVVRMLEGAVPVPPPPVPGLLRALASSGSWSAGVSPPYAGGESQEPTSGK